MSEHSIRPLTGIFALVLAGIAPSAFAATRKTFDFVVGVDGDFKAARDAAAKKASASYRYHIFLPDAEYNLGALIGDSNQKSTFTTANVSLVGQSADKTILYNKSVNEGIGITATLHLNNADNLYMQDLTVMNRANYGDPATYSATGRHVAIQEQSDKIIYKNVKQLSTQDTYYTKGTRTYWEGGEIHGTTDFICGGGDVFFQGTTLRELKDGAPITAASSAGNSWGYVFKDCTIDATKDGYLLGRSWGEAKVVFLNTTMKKIPSAAAWGEPMNSVPVVFAEYKSKNATGALVDLSKRRTTYTKDATTVKLNPVLTDAEAAKYTVAAVLGGTDNWQPQNLTKQVAAPVARLEGSRLVWTDDAEAMCWVVFRDGKYLANVATASLDVSKIAAGAQLTVRAANAMGGLGATSAAVTTGGQSAIGQVGKGSSMPSMEIGATKIHLEGFQDETGEVSVEDLAGRRVVSKKTALREGEGVVDLGESRSLRGLHVVRATSATGGSVARIHFFAP